jgi:GntR family transcriptional regulator of vanillate catabolism
VSGRLTEVQGVSLADQAREAIRTAILDGTFQPEERLTIEQLAEELGVSRTPVREALKALEGDGLVRLIPHRGAVVERLARDEIYHRYAIRAMLEGYAAELACRRDAARFARLLERNCEAIAALAEHASADDVAKLADLNRRFHAVIREGSASATLIRLLGSLRNPVAFTLNYWGDPVKREASLKAHRQIAAAFREADPELARHLTERHLLAARDDLLAGSRA